MSPSSAETPAAALLERLGPALRAPDAVLLVDGRSGSGKTALAAWLAPRLGARVLHLEDVYPDWTGLEAASRLLADRLLPAFRAHRPLEWRTWDWAAGRPGPAAHRRPGGRLIVEGCGSVTSASVRLADAAVVLEVGRDLRRGRILARDPAESLPGHEVWAGQERRFAAAHRPVAGALVLRGGAALPRTRSARLDTVTA